MPFKKGQSGNPGGRAKKNFQLVEACRQHGDEVREFMLSVMRGNIEEASTNDRIRAAEWLADRGFGKAPTVLAGQGGIGPAEITVHWADAPAPQP